MARFIVAEGDAGSFSYTDDAATATVTGVGPLLSGTLNYTANRFFQNGSSGRISGASSASSRRATCAYPARTVRP